MSPTQSIAFIGNYLPRRCGIGTFSHDLHCAIATARPNARTTVVAMTDAGRSYDYPPAVGMEIHADALGDYARAAEFLNKERFDVVSLQHEYGIFGGPAGSNILETLARLEMPIVTTLHTILPEPSPDERLVMRRINDVSSRIVVMSQTGRDLLRSVHGVPNRKIDVIPHGIPDVPFAATQVGKEKFGLAGRTVILTFGLLSPNKGIETVIDAMPKIIEACPNAVYVVLGATHPNLVRNHGEAYRDTLVARVGQLDLENHVVFVDQFVDQPTLLEYIAMCDVYVTPYLNEAQMTSGTLAYSFGLGKAVVSTPYWHARELLADGRGVLVPFGDARAVGAEIAALLTNDVRRQAMRERAYAESRSMTWAATAERYLESFDKARDTLQPMGAARWFERPAEVKSDMKRTPMRLGHFLSMCDDTGMLQHSVHSVADRAHGYCVDDNARALMLANALGRAGEVPLPDALTVRFAAFIQHAWNPDTSRFRNFMSFDRRWLEDTGSEDSHGRTMWALGECARYDTDASRRQWAASLFRTALPPVLEFENMRSWVFTLLGLDSYCAVVGDDAYADRVRGHLSDKLLALLELHQSRDWMWFEDTLAYDNARIPQALILAGVSTHTRGFIDAGLQTLTWLMPHQTAPSGCFRPVGNESFGVSRQAPRPFDQQPVEAAATISACLAASRVDQKTDWGGGAMRAYRWFLGENDLQQTLIDPISGGCCDGLHPDRPNQNQGAESTLSYLLGLAEVRRYQSTTNEACKTRSSNVLKNAEHVSTAARVKAGGHLVSIPLSESSERASAPRSIKGRGQAVQTGD